MKNSELSVELLKSYLCNPEAAAIYNPDKLPTAKVLILANGNGYNNGFSIFEPWKSIDFLEFHMSWISDISQLHCDTYEIDHVPPADKEIGITMFKDFLARNKVDESKPSKLVGARLTQIQNEFLLGLIVNAYLNGDLGRPMLIHAPDIFSRYQSLTDVTITPTSRESGLQWSCSFNIFNLIPVIALYTGFDSIVESMINKNSETPIAGLSEIIARYREFNTNRSRFSGYAKAANIPHISLIG